MAVDYLARSLLALRKQKKSEQIAPAIDPELIQSIADSSYQTAALNTALLAYMQQSNAIMYSLLDQASSSQDVQEMKTALKESLDDVKTVLWKKEEV